MTLNSATLYGSGVFTTVAIRNGEPLFWEKHWQRLTGNAARIGLDLSGNTDERTNSALEDAIRTSAIESGRARITFQDERLSEIWPGREPSQAASLHIIAGAGRPVPSPFRLTTSPYPVNSRSPLAGVKSCNYLENILAINEAKGRGFHEGIRVNERGHVAGGCMANVFWLKGERLYTPALSTGCLPGTTREYVLENLECEEVEAEMGVLADAHAVFMTSAGLGICPADEFDGHKLKGVDGQLLALWPPPH